MSDVVVQAVEGVIKGCGDVGLKIYKYWKDGRGLRKAIDDLEEMLRNPKWPYRTTAVLARALYDKSADRAVTVKVLQQIGARPNLREGGSDSWVKESNWILESNGVVARNKDGIGKLKPGITPGRK